MVSVVCPKYPYVPLHGRAMESDLTIVLLLNEIERRINPLNAATCSDDLKSFGNCSEPQVGCYRCFHVQGYTMGQKGVCQHGQYVATSFRAYVWIWSCEAIPERASKNFEAARYNMCKGYKCAPLPRV